MIISQQKNFKDINIEEQDIFIIGCAKCAAKLHVGGEAEVIELKEKLSSKGKNVVGYTVLSSACNIVWENIITQNPEIEKAKALLVLSCGAGVSVISKHACMQVYPALDTISLGGMCGGEVLRELCGMCGDCTVWMFGGICPVIRCPKGLLNGPCGGVIDGKCEVNAEICVWDEIFEKLKKLGKLEYLSTIHQPKNWSKR